MADDIVDELLFRVTVTRMGGQHTTHEVMSDIMAMVNARTEIVRLRAWGTSRVCSTCAAWEATPAEDQNDPPTKWGLCRAGMHDTTSDHFCASWEARRG